MRGIKTATNRLREWQVEQVALVSQDAPDEQAWRIGLREPAWGGVLPQLHALVGSKLLGSHFDLDTVGRKRDQANLLNPQTPRDC